jgi:PelA/Pel-15E family pectate lyase
MIPSGRRKSWPVVPVSVVVFLLVATTANAIRWERAQREGPEWFRSAEGKQVVDNVLAMQYPCGGWDKNLERSMDMAEPLSDSFKRRLARRADQATIDNGATYTQLRFLAGAYSATHDERVRDAINRGIDYLLAAQYENGGWPMFYPLRKGYYTHIHFNDNSVSGVMELMEDIARGEATFEFVDSDRRQKAAAAVAKGIDCILKCQVVVDGKRTVWCAQHDEETFAPAAARAFEPVSLSGHESVDLVRCLMRVENPSPEIIEAVESAVAWFDAAKIDGIRVMRVRTPDGWDRAVEKDPEASPIWARFYEIGTNRPIFTGRNRIVRYNYSEIEPERRRGYAYYGDWPNKLLRREYPAWRQKHPTREAG